MTTRNDSNNIVNLFILATLIVFAVMVVWFVFHVVLSAVLFLAPIAGVFAAIGGGIWYLSAEDDAQKVKALQMIVIGGIVAIVFGIIF